MLYGINNNLLSKNDLTKLTNKVRRSDFRSRKPKCEYTHQFKFNQFDKYLVFTRIGQFINKRPEDLSVSLVIKSKDFQYNNFPFIYLLECYYIMYLSTYTGNKNISILPEIMLENLLTNQSSLDFDGKNKQNLLCIMKQFNNLSNMPLIWSINNWYLFVLFSIFFDEQIWSKFNDFTILIHKKAMKIKQIEYNYNAIKNKISINEFKHVPKMLN